MINRLAEMLRDEISGLDFVEVAAGLARPVPIRNKQDEGIIDKIVPIAYNDLGIDCEEGELYPLVPNTKKKSIHWFEDGGITPTSEDTYYYHSQASLLLVSWWNLPLINAALTSPASLVAGIVAAVPARLNTVAYISQIRVQFAGEQNPETVLERYGFDIPENQVNTFPYAVTALLFTVDFAFGKNCVDLVSLEPSVCPPKMGAAQIEAVPLCTMTYAGANKTFYFSIYDGMSIVINWGDGTTQTVEGEGKDEAITVTSPYTDADTYTIQIHGAKNVTAITLPVFSGIGGDISWLEEFTNLETLYIRNTSHTGDVTGLSALTKLVNLFIIDGFPYTMNLIGDIAGFAVMTDLEELWLFDHPAITGDIATWTPVTKIEQIFLEENLVDGDIADFLAVLHHINPGEVASFSGTNVIYSTATLPNWDGISLLLDDIGFANAEIDSILSDLLTAGVVNCNIFLDETNGCPTDDTDYNSLVALGNTVQLNVCGLNAGGGTDSDWLFLTGGLARLWTAVTATCSRVTGNGFTGYAQRAVLTAATGYIYIAVNGDGDDVLTIGNTYQFDCMYRKSNGSPNLVAFAGNQGNLAIADNEGNALPSLSPSFVALSTLLVIRMTGGAPGDWFEIDELVITQL